MTFEQRIGFEVAKELLERHNEELQKAKKEFYKIFGEVWDEAAKKGIKIFDLKSVLENYLDAIRKEYYEVGKVVDSTVQEESIKNEV
ncbi:MAG: hypothetical protein Q4D53_06600 [Leptotrichiaceae bacterium]|nr:hypothetical protein [Leptotrichiaceae bacterium]